MNWPEEIAKEVQSALKLWTTLKAQHPDTETPNTDETIAALTAARLCDHHTATSATCPLCGYQWTGRW